MNTSSSTTGGIGVVGLLTVLFIAFKLAGIIDWSWWWVFSPIWISWLITLGIFAFAFVVMWLGDSILKKKWRD